MAERPLHELVVHADGLVALFEGAYERWEYVGAIRRQERGDAVDHLVIPTIKSAKNLVWKRVEELAAHNHPELRPCTAPLTSIEPERQQLTCDRNQVHHTIYLATRNNWGMRLCQRTGPAGYWEMLFYRLHHEGTLKVHLGEVCHVCRKDADVRLDPIEVPDEKEFFRLARTPWKEPKQRFCAYPERYASGMAKPYLPEFLLPYADPLKHPHLFGATDYRRKRRKKP